MLKVLVIVVALLFATSAQADCVRVLDASVEVDKGDEGAGRVHWHARLENSCDRDQDAMLTARFLDAGGESVYEIQDQLIVPRRSEQEAGRRIYVPAMYIGPIEAIDVRVEARERPF